MAMKAGIANHAPFSAVKDELKRIYLTPLLEIHQQKPKVDDDKRASCITMEDLEKSFKSASEYFGETCHGGQKRMAQSFLDQLHSSQLTAYDEYFYRHVWLKARGQDLMANWKQQINCWDSSSSKNDAEERILSQLLNIKVTPSDRAGKMGRYKVVDGWQLTLDHIFEWIVDSLVKTYVDEKEKDMASQSGLSKKNSDRVRYLSSDSLGLISHAEEDGDDEDGEINETDEGDNEDESAVANENDGGGEDEDDGEVNETETEAEENEDDEEEEGEVDESSTPQDNPLASAPPSPKPHEESANTNTPKRAQAPAQASADTSKPKNSTRSTMLKRKIASLAGAATAGGSSTKAPAVKKKFLRGALGSGRKSNSALSGAIPKKRKQANDGNATPKQQPQTKQRTVNANANAAAQNHNAATNKAKRGGRGGRVGRKKLS
jgi:hypothetical protein